MVGNLVGDVGTGAVEMGEPEPDLRAQRVRSSDQPHAAGEPDESPMDLQVRLGQRGRVRGVPGESRVALQRVANRRSIRRGRLRPAAYAGRLQCLAGETDVMDVIGGELLDRHTLVGYPDGDAFADQDRQRLADGAPSDTHRLRERDLA